jgi:hypothetical protein
LIEKDRINSLVLDLDINKKLTDFHDEFKNYLGIVSIPDLSDIQVTISMLERIQRGPFNSRSYKQACDYLKDRDKYLKTYRRLNDNK